MSKIDFAEHYRLHSGPQKKALFMSVLLIVTGWLKTGRKARRNGSKKEKRGERGQEK